jgi:dephospho-CoA kinase
MILGITGTDGAGKGTVVAYLVNKKGFTHYSARALFVEEIKRQGLEISRANMRIVGNELRKKHGSGYLVNAYLEKKETEGISRVVIESIRSIGEAEALKLSGGILLAVDAGRQLRYARVVERGSESDNISFEGFVRQEEIEKNDPNPHGMQKAAVIKMADFLIQNNGTLEELHARVDEVLGKIQ